MIIMIPVWSEVSRKFEKYGPLKLLKLARFGVVQLWKRTTPEFVWLKIKLRSKTRLIHLNKNWEPGFS